MLDDIIGNCAPVLLQAMHMTGYVQMLICCSLLTLSTHHIHADEQAFCTLHFALCVTAATWHLSHALMRPIPRTSVVLLLEKCAAKAVSSQWLHAIALTPILKQGCAL